MGIGRSIGKATGALAGSVIGGGVKLVGKASKQDWIEEVGEGMKQASTIALEHAGQLVDGVSQSAYGYVKKDEEAKRRGLHNLKEPVVKTAKGIGKTVTYVGKSTATTIDGVISHDKEKAVQGLKNVGKVAVVATLAVGVLDLVEGAEDVQAETIETRNGEMDIHSETGVPFIEKEVELPDGKIVEGNFPVFESNVQVQLDESVYMESDATHFRLANEAFYEQIQQNPAIGESIGLSTADVYALSFGETPEGFTWHHNEELGVLQLVDQEVHEQTGHTGGRQLWGGGAENR